MNQCPACKKSKLENVTTDHGQFRVCPECDGMLVALGLLQRVSNPKLLSSVWRDARSRALASGRLCPDCPRGMLHAVIQKDDLKTEIDLCENCFLLWFDSSEIDSLPRASEQEIDTRSAPRPENRQSLIPIQVDIRVNGHVIETIDHPDVGASLLERLVSRFI